MGHGLRDNQEKVGTAVWQETLGSITCSDFRALGLLAPAAKRTIARPQSNFYTHSPFPELIGVAACLQGRFSPADGNLSLFQRVSKHIAGGMSC